MTLKTHSQPSVTIDSTSMDSTNHSWKSQSLVESETAKTLQYREPTVCILKKVGSSNSCFSRAYCIYHILFSLCIHPLMGSCFHTLAIRNATLGVWSVDYLWRKTRVLSAGTKESIMGVWRRELSRSLSWSSSKPSSTFRANWHLQFKPPRLCCTVEIIISRAEKNGTLAGRDRSLHKAFFGLKKKKNHAIKKKTV